jgi:hypothetical protein
MGLLVSLSGIAGRLLGRLARRTPAPIFGPGAPYLRDHMGRYRELCGIVVHAGLPDDDDLEVWSTVSTSAGKFHCSYHMSRFLNWYRRFPSVGDHVTIRAYAAGGGHYPDDIISGFDGPCAAPEHCDVLRVLES